MNKTFLVLKHEIVTIVTSKSFLLAAFGVPFVSALIFGVTALVSQNSQASSAISNIFNAPQALQADGYVDESRLIQALPEEIPAGALVAYVDEAAARQALAAGEIGAFYVLPRDYLETGKLLYVRPDFNPISSMGNSWLFDQVIRFNLLNGDGQLASRISTPLIVQVQTTTDQPQREESNPLTFYLPYAVTMLYYFIILGAASLLLSSVTKEKENRVIEILMVSVTPRQLLTGKILGLGLVGLVQNVLWVGTGFTLLRLSGRTFSLPAAFQLPLSFLAWGVVFFLLGYAVYASLMAGLGALVPNLREAGQATIFVIMPLIIPLLFISVLIEDYNGPLATILSLFPLSAPVAMMTRLAAGNIPFWQPALAAALLAVTAALIVRAVANMFRAQTLLSGQAFNFRRFLAALVGRA